MDIQMKTAISLLQTEGFMPFYFSSMSDLSTFSVNSSDSQKTIKVLNFEVDSSLIPPELFPESASVVTLLKVHGVHDFNGSQDQFHQYLEGLWPRFVFRVFGRPINSTSSSWMTIRIRKPLLIVFHGHSYEGKSSAVRSLNSLKRISCDDEIYLLENTDSGKWAELKEAAMAGISELNIAQAIFDIHDRKLWPDLVSFLIRNVSPSENLILDLFMTIDMHGDFLEATNKFDYKVFFAQNAEENHSLMTRVLNERNNLIASVGAISQQRDIAIAERDRVLNSRIWKIMKLYKKLRNFSRIR